MHLSCKAVIAFICFASCNHNNDSLHSVAHEHDVENACCFTVGDVDESPLSDPTYSVARGSQLGWDIVSYGQWCWQGHILCQLFAEGMVLCQIA